MKNSQIRRFDVPVGDPLAMRVCEAPGELHQVVQLLGERTLFCGAAAGGFPRGPGGSR